MYNTEATATKSALGSLYKRSNCTKPLQVPEARLQLVAAVPHPAAAHLTLRLGHLQALSAAEHAAAAAWFVSSLPSLRKQQRQVFLVDPDTQIAAAVNHIDDQLSRDEAGVTAA